MPGTPMPGMPMPGTPRPGTGVPGTAIPGTPMQQSNSMTMSWAVPVQPADLISIISDFGAMAWSMVIRIVSAFVVFQHVPVRTPAAMSMCPSGTGLTWAFDGHVWRVRTCSVAGLGMWPHFWGSAAIYGQVRAHGSSPYSGQGRTPQGLGQEYLTVGILPTGTQGVVLAIPVPMPPQNRGPMVCAGTSVHWVCDEGRHWRVRGCMIPGFGTWPPGHGRVPNTPPREGPMPIWPPGHVPQPFNAEGDGRWYPIYQRPNWSCTYTGLGPWPEHIVLTEQYDMGANPSGTNAPMPTAPSPCAPTPC